MTRGVRLVGAVIGALGLCVFAACSSDSSTSSSSKASSPTTCPFSGGTATQTNPGAPPGTAAELSSVEPSSNGCIQQVKLNFTSALPPSTIGYSNAGSGTSGANQLVIQLGPAPPGGVPSSVSYSGPSSVSPGSATHASAIAVASSNGAVTVTLSLDHQAPFTLSVSQRPQYIIVAFV